MEFLNTKALEQCIREAIRSEISLSLREKGLFKSESKKEELLTKKEMAEELDISLVTLTDWMKKGLPYHRLHRRIYFKKEEVMKSMEKF